MVQDPKRWTRWAVALTVLWLLGNVGQTALYLWRINVLRNAGVTPDAMAAAIETPEAASFLFILSSILYHVVFLRWVYVVNRNAQQWSDAMTVGPGWNVGWFFIPIACLWKPFEGIREVRGATIAPEAPDSVAVPSWMNLWWGLWVGAAIYGNVLALLVGAPTTPTQWISVSGAQAASIIIDVPLAVLTCRLLNDIARLQSQRMAEDALTPMEDDPQLSGK